SYGRLHLAGHPQPLLITSGGVRELQAPVCTPPGIAHSRDWPSSEVTLGPAWSLIMYTDGLVEGRIGEGPERLGSEGLTDIIRTFLGSTRVMRPAERKQRDEHLLGWLVDHVRELNGATWTTTLPCWPWDSRLWM